MIMMPYNWPRPIIAVHSLGRLLAPHRLYRRLRLALRAGILSHTDAGARASGPGAVWRDSEREWAERWKP